MSSHKSETVPQSVIAKMLGSTVGPYRDEVTQERISAFCKAIGAPESSIAPPTFLTVFRKGEFDFFEKMGVPLSNVLHGEQEYEYDQSIQAGDHILFETSVIQVLEKKGSSGMMQILTFESRYKAERQGQDHPIGKAKTTVVIRERKA